jgi:hypothetical protein
VGGFPPTHHRKWKKVGTFKIFPLPRFFLGITTECAACFVIDNPELIAEAAYNYISF